MLKDILEVLLMEKTGKIIGFRLDLLFMCQDKFNILNLKVLKCTLLTYIKIFTCKII